MGRTFIYVGDAAALKEKRFDRKLWARQMGQGSISYSNEYGRWNILGPVGSEGWIGKSRTQDLMTLSCQTFGCLGNRKPGLPIESGRICEMDELVFCLPEKKWMSIYAGLSFLAIVSPGTCPAEPLSYPFIAEPIRTSE
jgi:hypothetical protein